ncbi:uncharacterized protein LOC100906928 [Galendromus occidentalis]|uniref:Uncharacterized protein LOC100906928 n=1 Tax=Galendromus occidentalis TaxID=34638 RepID=A0AAJ6QRS2_9ACAR|nr:uncharacterized protein LOC100906928 [Galendromus occidentalis]
MYLMVPSIVTKSGRVILAVYALEQVLTGPITDFLLNLDIFLRTCICFIKLFLKYTIDSYKLCFDPAFKVFSDIMSKDRHDVFNYTESDMSWVFDVTSSEPLTQDLGFNFLSLNISVTQLDYLRITYREYQNWVNKLRTTKDLGGAEGDLRVRCEILLFLAHLRCVEKVHDSWPLCDWGPGVVRETCREVCRPIIVMLTEDFCGTEKVTDQFHACDNLKFPEWFARNNSFDIAGVNTERSTLDDAYNEASNYLRTYRARTALLGNILEIALLLITPCCFVVIYGFLHKYQHYPSFHNCYVYGDFGKFSEQSGLRLDEKDLKRVATFWTPKPLDNEWHGIERLVFSKVWLTVVLGICALSVNHLMANVLKVMKEESRLSGVYNTEQNLSVQVVGIGIVAKFMRSFLGYLVSSSRVSSNVDTAVCLVSGHDSGKTGLILGIYVFMVFTCVAEVYAFRLRFLLCRYFYPEAHRRRMLYLCHAILLWRSQRAAIAVEMTRASPIE